MVINNVNSALMIHSKRSINKANQDFGDGMHLYDVPCLTHSGDDEEELGMCQHECDWSNVCFMHFMLS